MTPRKYTYWHVIYESTDPKYPVGCIVGGSERDTEWCRFDHESRDILPYAKLKFLKRFPIEISKTNKTELCRELEKLAESALKAMGITLEEGGI